MSEDAPETPVAPDDTTPPPPVVPDPPAVPELPLVDTGKLITLTADPAVSAALTAQGFLTAGGDLRSAYAAWQTSLGYDGDTADGVPDLRSLRCLAQEADSGLDLGAARRDDKLSALVVSLLAVAAAAVTGLTTWLVALRSNSGTVETSEASSLWAESQIIRKELREEAIARRVELEQVRASMALLEKDYATCRRESLALIMRLERLEAQTRGSQ